MSTTKTTQVLASNLIKIAQAYAKANRMTLGAVGRKFYGSPTFFGRLKAGTRSISIHKYGEMIEGFRKDWPEKADWPYVPAIIIERHPH